MQECIDLAFKIPSVIVICVGMIAVGFFLLGARFQDHISKKERERHENLYR